MSLSLKPLLYKVYEKIDNEEVWPKKLIGGSLVYLEKANKYILIGGNFNAFENANKNIQLNREILGGSIETFNKLESSKRAYLTESVYNNNQSTKMIDVYVYELSPERKWYKASSSGRVPRARSFHRCITIGNFIFI
jgi:hypothetical protein